MNLPRPREALVIRRIAVARSGPGVFAERRTDWGIEGALRAKRRRGEPNRPGEIGSPAIQASALGSSDMRSRRRREADHNATDSPAVPPRVNLSIHASP